MQNAQEIRISLPNLDEDAVHADQVRGREALSELYEFEVDVISPKVLDLESMLGKAAKLTIKVLDETFEVKGIILFAGSLDPTRNREFVYRIVIGPAMSLMRLSGQNQVYGTDRDMTVLDIIDAELSDAVKSGSVTGGNRAARRIPHRMLASGAYPKLPFVLQYLESDFAFFSRLCEKFGIFYAFDHKGEQEELLICDRNVHFNRMAGKDLTEELPFRSGEQLIGSGGFAVRSFNSAWTVKPGHVQLRDYNDDTPSVDLKVTASTSFEGQGIEVRYGEHYATPQDGQSLAKVRAEMLEAERLRFIGKSNIPLMRPGMFFKLVDHPDSAFERHYAVTEVVHRIAEPTPSGFSSPDKVAEPYSNEFVCLPMDAPFRPSLKTPKPIVHGLLHAVIDGSEGADRAELDDQGRYHVRILDEESGLSGGKASHTVRKAEPYGGGDGYGSHSTLLVGTEVLLAFINGDPDRPVIAGAMSNGEKSNPVSERNAAVAHRTRTASGIVFEFNDGGL
ncbi:type VI secretion system tip protein VgrG [Ciceribacter sp. L1K23]|uniref:type VI secretion system Vgr family protein n=1 Tax=Ciceribacter sp. L1K23 TaxID=2820276 RepID=UPI001B83A5CA|nr:type VI secretion system tip protein TssI/VgrG [Ciceribacter sp. L1K23]MBR0558394.1 type VI secretion system tip protein VgrG [Ciceribacter sp. L1K23]